MFVALSYAIYIIHVKFSSEQFFSVEHLLNLAQVHALYGLTVTIKMYRLLTIAVTFAITKGNFQVHLFFLVEHLLCMYFHKYIHNFFLIFFNVESIYKMIKIYFYLIIFDELNHFNLIIFARCKHSLLWLRQRGFFGYVFLTVWVC